MSCGRGWPPASRAVLRLRPGSLLHSPHPSRGWTRLLGDLIAELLPILHDLFDVELRDDTAQRTLKPLGDRDMDRLVLRGEALSGSAHLVGQRPGLHERDGRQVDGHAVLRLSDGLHLDLPRTQ